MDRLLANETFDAVVAALYRRIHRRGNRRLDRATRLQRRRQERSALCRISGHQSGSGRRERGLHSAQGFLVSSRVKKVLNKTVHREAGAISAEALVGLGITIGALGLLCLLLGWAEKMRAVEKISVLWLSVGAVMVVLGGIMAVMARRRPR